MAEIISGKEVAAVLNEGTAAKVAELKNKGIGVSLAVIIVGDDPASKVYVNNKKKACEKLGITSYEYVLPESTTQEELMQTVKELNERADVNGILCQLPLPKHLDSNAVIDAIAPEKDVDCFSPTNVGLLNIGRGRLSPCTPAGIMDMLEYKNISVSGKHCVVIGRSNIVGKPMSALLLAADATVTVCHSKTQNLKEITKTADVLIAAVGRPKFVTADMVKDGAVVIDVGIHRTESGKLCGDVDFDSVEPKASYITPVPGGVGPMTIARLMRNTVTAAKLQNTAE
ncbi:MAG: bifunctional methylenetetrahydrofolate dehydrogenase/methenyltetrahydrofolate cyclohydrolase FolD [Ruminococcus sp.]|nr:bifunctional methylenetetrahydrofolate dehydrogenase/methenyltetrahydrofolate cyclohydrolase FolD [Ruminococcus sp.]MDD7337458.1 bifunctional methylenetetrahydrofolate dehydrogenase/methenyltetrahydrofolate cyclohydrolase FolD [Ruminococcus sp.]